jgi:hypothetical protein
MANEEVLRRQLEWASKAGISTEGGYCVSPEQNLAWLTPRLRADVEQGDGNEFGGEDKRGKILALHSSSALGLNFFGYWQLEVDRDPLQRALGLASHIDSVEFERKFQTGVPPRSPNLDVVLTLRDGSILAIESKFTEWQGAAGTKPLRDAYLSSERWASVGLAGAQQAAKTYMQGSGFQHLDVPQLLKHMLGLATQSKPWHLLLVWFSDPSPAGKDMEGEIMRFRELLGSDAPRFSAITYQELWGRLRGRLGDEHGQYRHYLQERYF